MNLFRKHIFLFLLFCFAACSLFAQQKVAQYTKDFSFKEGVYLSFADFKNHNPIPVSKVVFNVNRGDRDFLKYALDKKEFVYLDSLGREQKIETTKVWGYCSNNVVNINYGTSFNRVVVIGSISHFVATIQTIVSIRNPYYYYDPYYNRTQYSYVTGQYILDFETGTVGDFNVANMESLLQRDQELHKEFMTLSKKKKKDSIFIYLRKFNDKHPIYFPL